MVPMLCFPSRKLKLTQPFVLPSVSCHKHRKVTQLVRKMPILLPAAVLVPHKLFDLGVMMWSLWWPGYLGLGLRWHVIVFLTQDLFNSWHIVGHFVAGVRPFHYDTEM